MFKITAGTFSMVCASPLGILEVVDYMLDLGHAPVVTFEHRDNGDN